MPHPPPVSFLDLVLASGGTQNFGKQGRKEASKEERRERETDNEKRSPLFLSIISIRLHVCLPIPAACNLPVLHTYN